MTDRSIPIHLASSCASKILGRSLRLFGRSPPGHLLSRRASTSPNNGALSARAFISFNRYRSVFRSLKTDAISSRGPAKSRKKLSSRFRSPRKSISQFVTLCKTIREITRKKISEITLTISSMNSFMQGTLAGTRLSPSAVHAIVEIGARGSLSSAELCDILTLEAQASADLGVQHGWNRGGRGIDGRLRVERRKGIAETADVKARMKRPCTKKKARGDRNATTERDASRILRRGDRLVGVAGVVRALGP